MRDIIFNTFLIRVTLFAGSSLSIFCVILIPFLNSINLTVVQISYLFLVKKIARVFTDILFGAIFDKYGGKFVLIFSRLCKIFSLFLILKYYSLFSVLMIAMFIDGLAESSIFNKSEVFVYNHFSEKRKITAELYSKLLAIFYFSIDLMFTLSGFIGSYLYMKTGRYDIIIISSIVYLTLSLFLMFRIENVKSQKLIQNKSVFGNLREISLFIKNSSFDYRRHGIMLSVISFLTWDLTNILSIFLAKNNFAPEKIGLLQSIFSMCLSIGCLVPLIIRMKNFSQIILSFFFINFLIIFGVIFKNYGIMIAVVMLLPLIFTVSEAFLLSYLDSNISKELRASGIAVFTTLEALLKIIGVLFFAKFSDMFNESYGVIAFTSISLIFLIYSSFKRKNYSI